ncbi:hypothetical protein TIFTF001_017763 [Ficus carica]|uniref:Uncharacterized protein n=1 Tax=Ficus carica TaxID=3494 RepID=A0AA88A5Q8_FICCA|nr:hypothetical protein TIFTF001_017763 [Ficus carica]
MAGRLPRPAITRTAGPRVDRAATGGGSACSGNQTRRWCSLAHSRSLSCCSPSSVSLPAVRPLPGGLPGYDGSSSTTCPVLHLCFAAVVQGSPGWTGHSFDQPWVTGSVVGSPTCVACQALDIPGENLCLRGFTLGSDPSPARGSPGALRTGGGRIVVMDVLIISLVHFLSYLTLGERVYPVTLPSITCKREAPRSDWDAGVVSTVGTPMPKSARAPHAIRTARVTQPGRLSRAPGAAPVEAGGDVTLCSSRLGKSTVEVHSDRT